MPESELLRAQFKLMDVDKQGAITISNLKRVLNHELNLCISDELVQDMIKEASGQADEVTEAQFLKFLKKYKRLH